jgi:hypothetical protein
MNKMYDDLPGCFFSVLETSAGVFRANGKDCLGHAVETTGTDPDEQLEGCKATARQLIPDSDTIDHLWFALDRAVHRPESLFWHDPPWESASIAVRQAWAVITFPENRKELEKRLSGNLNPHTRRVTIRVLEECNGNDLGSDR